MARRRNESPQKAAMRKMMQEYLKSNDISIKDETDVNAVMRDMMSVILEGTLDEEMDEELGYSSHRVLIRTRLKMHYFDMKCVCFQSAYVQYASFNILFHIEILDFINL